MKTIATALTAFCIMFAAVQWWQVIYRVELFYSHYGGERYVNHVGDGVYPLIHVINIALLLAGAFATRTCWREPGAWRWCVAGIAVANASAWLMFIYMHATGVLVEYGEFIRHMREQR